MPQLLLRGGIGVSVRRLTPFPPTLNAAQLLVRTTCSSKSFVNSSSAGQKKRLSNSLLHRRPYSLGCSYPSSGDGHCNQRRTLRLSRLHLPTPSFLSPTGGLKQICSCSTVAEQQEFPSAFCLLTLSGSLCSCFFTNRVVRRTPAGGPVKSPAFAGRLLLCFFSLGRANYGLNLLLFVTSGRSWRE